MECHGRNALRRAAAHYERAIDLDPAADKPRCQLILARAALFEPEASIALYRERLAAAPTDLREHRFLASAYLAARAYREAGEVADAGLALAADDPVLLAARGEVRAAAGDTDGALADWRRALEVDPEHIGPVYSSGFLLERAGRLAEAVAAWRFIVEWCEVRGHALEAEWPRRELGRLTESLGADGAA